MAEVYGRCKTQCYHRKRLWEPGQMAVFKDKKSVHHCFEYCGVVAKVDEAKAIVEAQKQKAIEEGQLAEEKRKALEAQEREEAAKLKAQQDVEKNKEAARIKKEEAKAKKDAAGNPKAPKEADQSQPSDQGELL